MSVNFILTITCLLGIIRMWATSKLPTLAKPRKPTQNLKVYECNV